MQVIILVGTYIRFLAFRRELNEVKFKLTCPSTTLMHDTNYENIGYSLIGFCTEISIVFITATIVKILEKHIVYSTVVVRVKKVVRTIFVEGKTVKHRKLQRVNHPR